MGKITWPLLAVRDLSQQLEVKTRASGPDVESPTPMTSALNQKACWVNLQTVPVSKLIFTQMRHLRSCQEGMDISFSVTSQGFISGRAEQGLGIYPQEASYLSSPFLLTTLLMLSSFNSKIKPYDRYHLCHFHSAMHLAACFICMEYLI